MTFCVATPLHANGYACEKERESGEERGELLGGIRITSQILYVKLFHNKHEGIQLHPSASHDFTLEEKKG